MNLKKRIKRLENRGPFKSELERREVMQRIHEKDPWIQASDLRTEEDLISWYGSHLEPLPGMEVTTSDIRQRKIEGFKARRVEYEANM